MRIPRPHVHDGSSMASGDSEYTIAEEIERRVITDVKTTETRTVTTEADVHGAASSTIETSYRTYGDGESAMHSAGASSQQVGSSLLECNLLKLGVDARTLDDRGARAGGECCGVLERWACARMALGKFFGLWCST